MKIATAKEYYELNVLTGFDAVRDPLSHGWLLSISGKEGRCWTLQTALGATKTYSTLDSVVVEVQRITGRVSSLHIHV
jgi:hypothetical protein